MNFKNTIMSTSWFHNLWPGLAPALLFLSTSCQHNDIPVTPGAADHALDQFIPIDTALHLCRFSRGTLPNWMLWREYQDYLSPSEKQAFHDLEQSLLAQIPVRHRPKATAVATFIAKHTHCLYEHDLPPITEIDKTGARAYTFLQNYPVVPNVPEPPNLDTMTPDEQKNAWIDALDSAYNQNSRQRQIRIIVEQNEKNSYILRSNIQKIFSEPLKIQNFWNNIDALKLTDAFESLVMACTKNDPSCEDLRTYWIATELFRKDSAQKFENAVEISKPKMTSVALTGTSSYTVAQMTLTNHSDRTFSNVIFTTDEVKPQHCLLQETRTKRDDHPLTLQPGQSAQAYCALDADTRPWVNLSVWIADSTR